MGKKTSSSIINHSNGDSDYYTNSMDNIPLLEPNINNSVNDNMVYKRSNRISKVKE